MFCMSSYEVSCLVNVPSSGKSPIKSANVIFIKEKAVTLYFAKRAHFMEIVFK